MPPFFWPRFVRRVERHHETALIAVGRPVRQVGTVGIAVPDKVDPVARRQFRQRVIGVFVQPRECMEIVEHIEEFARVEGASVATVALAKPALRR